MPWWRGSRGEWFVVIQAGLFLLVLFGPRDWSGLPSWTAPYSRLGSISGGAFMAAGFVLALGGTFSLGKNLTPLPHPKSDTTLVVTGAYRLVRHPIYSGIIFILLGWGLWLNSIIVIGYALIFFLFFDIKSRREEVWLVERFPEYAGYRKRVRKLIPFVY
jgi:protein-S-isoprenylcysteine O-methyltransferase Ste14